MMYPELIPGDIVITRNEGSDEDENATPGYWNHVGIYVGDDRMVEAQAPGWGGKVLTSNRIEYMKRYPIIVVKRSLTHAQGVLAAEDAKKSVDTIYRKIASLFIFLRKRERGENCVSVVRRAYMEATGRDPKWRTPDDVYNDENLDIVYEHNELEADHEMES